MNDGLAERAQASGGLRPMYFYLIVILVFVTDQASKALIQRSMSFGEFRPVFGTNFMLTLTQNTGGAWGLAPSKNGLFVAFAVVAIVALLYAYHRIARGDLLVASAFALALGGAVGNLIDRLRFGYVVDFFDVRVIHWPIFNVADSAISLGIVLLLLHYLRSLRMEAAARRELADHVTPGPALATDDLAKNTRE